MATYYAGSGGGCFGSSSTVVVVKDNGLEESVAVADIRAGDTVKVSNGTALVQCVVQIKRAPTKPLVMLPGGLTITPRHPVCMNGQWRLPVDLGAGRAVPNPCGRVYNFVLDRCHVLLVNGVECVTWGHGLLDQIVVHTFYGTSRVTETLAAMPGWEHGLVFVEGCIKDSTGQVIDLLGLHDSLSCSATAFSSSSSLQQERLSWLPYIHVA